MLLHRAAQAQYVVTAASPEAVGEKQVPPQVENRKGIAETPTRQCRYA